jgi:hypothetical protein
MSSTCAVAISSMFRSETGAGREVLSLGSGAQAGSLRGLPLSGCSAGGAVGKSRGSLRGWIRTRAGAGREAG